MNILRKHFVVAGIVLAVLCIAADLKISQLPNKTLLDGNEELPFAQGSTNGAATVKAIAAFVGSTSNINNYIITTNLTVYETNIFNYTITTNLYVYNTNIVNWTITTNLVVINTNIVNYEIVTNLYVNNEYVQNTYVTTNLYVTNNSYVFNTNFVNYEYVTNLYSTFNYVSNLFSTNIYVSNLFATNIYVSNIYTTNIWVQNIFVESNIFVTNILNAKTAYITNLIVGDLWRTNRTVTLDTNTTSATLNFMSDKDWVEVPNLMVTNITLSPTNLMAGREMWVFLTAASCNYDVVITNTAATAVHWNLNSPTNGTTSFKMTNGMSAELCLTIHSNNILHAVYGYYR